MICADKRDAPHVVQRVCMYRRHRCCFLCFCPNWRDPDDDDEEDGRRGANFMNYEFFLFVPDLVDILTMG